MSYKLVIDINDLPLIDRARKHPAVMAEAKRRILETGAIMMWGKAKEYAPKDTGKLSSSITKHVNTTGGKATVGTNFKYAPYQEFGTGIYGIYHRPITPKRAKVLRFKVNGKWVYARSVRGVRPKKYFKRALDYTSRNTKKALTVGANYIKSMLG